MHRGRSRKAAALVFAFSAVWENASEKQAPIRSKSQTRSKNHHRLRRQVKRSIINPRAPLRCQNHPRSRNRRQASFRFRQVARHHNRTASHTDPLVFLAIRHDRIARFAVVQTRCGAAQSYKREIPFQHFTMQSLPEFIPVKLRSQERFVLFRIGHRSGVPAECRELTLSAC